MKPLVTILLLSLSISVNAQQFNNEWIDYSKTYYKFKIGKTGLYRIPQSALNGIGLGSVKADHFQIWRNGQQVPVYTSVQGTALGATDYIEFWGEMNDGKPDNALYRDSDYQLSDKWSLETDTAAYFLTVNAAGPNNRLDPTPNNIAGNTLPAEPFFIHTAGVYYKNRIHEGRAEVIGESFIYSSSYDKAEGWSSGFIGSGQQVQFSFSNLMPYTGAGAPSPTVKVNAAGSFLQKRYIQIGLNADSINGHEMDYFNYMRSVTQVDISKIAAGSGKIIVINKAPKNPDRIVVSQIELVYPRVFNLGGAQTFEFSLPANAQGNYLEIKNFNYSSVQPVLYDLTNGRRYLADISDPATLKFALLSSASDRKLVLVSQLTSSIGQVTELQTRNFINYGASVNQGNFLIITNAAFTAASGAGDPAEDYRAYRSSAAGGAFQAKLYLVDQLVDQFAFGIKMHPLAIWKFIRFARAKYPQPIRNVLLIGRGITYNQARSQEANADLQREHFVPTFGNPASDVMFTSEINQSIPQIPIGRIGAINKVEAANYLEKLKEYEEIDKASSPLLDESSWKKSVIHVTGANDDNTTSLLAAALSRHQKIIEAPKYGAFVHNFTKTSAESVTAIANKRLGELFESGLGLFTYFGHSSGNTLDFNLDNPYNYNNYKKYPLFIVMGCYAGGFFDFSTSRLNYPTTISESYVLAKQRGSIGFLAGTTLGIIHYLDSYNTHFYTAVSKTKYGSTLGEQMQEACTRMISQFSPIDYFVRVQNETFALHGDPAVKLHAAAKPDVAIEPQGIIISPSLISISEGEFRMKAWFQNIGLLKDTSIVINIRRTFPDQSFEVIKDTIRITKFADTIYHSFLINPIRDKGMSKITVTLDADNWLDELYESNNTATKDVFIVEDVVYPIFPYEYAIVNQQNIKLVASTSNPFAVPRTYVMELDTTAEFSSPLKITRQLQNVPGGVLEFSPGVNFTDSTVYYWRVGSAVTTGEPMWSVSSFQYIENGEQGYSQAHHYQFQNNTNGRLKYGPGRQFNFGNQPHEVSVSTAIFPNGGQATHYSLSIDGIYLQSGLYGPLSSNANVLRFYVVNEKTFKPWVNVSTGSQGLYGSTNPVPVNGSTIPGFFQFDISSTQARKTAMDFIDIVPAGHYIIVTNSPYQSTVLPSVWQDDTLTLGSGVSLYHKLVSLGFTNLSAVNSYVPFIFIAQKGIPVALREIVASQNVDIPHTIIDLEGIYAAGSYTSEILGPAKKWEKLYWKGHSAESPSKDEANVALYGVAPNGTLILLTTVSPSTVPTPIDWIDAKQYPKLVLRLNAVDTADYSPYQLDHWMLTGIPAPEGAIAPNVYFESKDTADIGELVNFGIAFKNVSNVAFDSLKVKFSVTDKNNVENIFPISRQKALVSGDTVNLKVSVDTKTIPGSNSLFVNFNPDGDQPEQYLFNNFAFRNLYVVSDDLNPLMDVTFDGVHILNRDIVSSSPQIVIELKDENSKLILNDTSTVVVQVRYPDGSIHPYYYNGSGGIIQFTPGNTGDNKAKVDFKPSLLEDGEYELIVSGKDRSGNAAGAASYRVSFTVINKPMISNMLNYPNPFTTATAFVFTLTGSEVPQNIRIQILTITGKIVREITKDELGPIHIGRNITEFKWDGTDQYGQKLANGVYLYRFITNLNGKSLDKYKSKNDQTDKYFNKGYGKMYLMR